VSWSIFREGGGKGAAQAWAQSLLQGIGAPTSDANVQVVYDWEVSEGAGGKNNPLNQGAVPGHPELTAGSSSAAADYVSLQAGLQGSIDYLNMSNYAAVKKSLIAGDAAAARAAIIASPWAGGHYGNGSSFATDPLPGKDSQLPGIINAGLSVPNPGDIVGSVGSTFLNGILDALGLPDVKELAERAALILFGTILLTIGILRFTGQDKNVVRGVKAYVTKGASETEETAETETGDEDAESE
jgi:hypothetical protein